MALLATGAPTGIGGMRITHPGFDPDDIEIELEGPSGTTFPFRPLAADGIVRGLQPDRAYRFRLMSLSTREVSDWIRVRTRFVDDPILPPGRPIPLTDGARQSMVVRLDNKNCRLHIWWQPSDSAWYASLEIPTNTPAVSSRKIVVDSGLLDRLPWLLNGNVICRSIGGRDEPGRHAWRDRTHLLLWESY